MTDIRTLAKSVYDISADLRAAANIAIQDRLMPDLARREGLLAVAEEARDRLTEILEGEGSG